MLFSRWSLYVLLISRWSIYMLLVSRRCRIITAESVEEVENKEATAHCLFTLGLAPGKYGLIKPKGVEFRHLCNFLLFQTTCLQSFGVGTYPPLSSNKDQKTDFCTEVSHIWSQSALRETTPKLRLFRHQWISGSSFRFRDIAKRS